MRSSGGGGLHICAGEHGGAYPACAPSSCAVPLVAPCLLLLQLGRPAAGAFGPASWASSPQHTPKSWHPPLSSQVCLHPLVAARHDGGMLLGALRQLSAGEALALLRYLRTLLHNYAALVGDRWRGLVGVPGGLPAATVLPHPAAVVEWAGAALDANMARLVLQPQVRGARPRSSSRGVAAVALSIHFAFRQLACLGMSLSMIKWPCH